MCRQYMQGLTGPHQGFLRPAPQLQRHPHGLSWVPCAASRAKVGQPASPDELTHLTVAQLREELGKLGLTKGVCTA